MSPLRSPYIKVECPDGRPRYILKNPDQAFAIAFPEWDVKVGNILKTLEVTDSLNSRIGKKTKAIVTELTERYATLQAHYKVSYLAYCGNPCSKEREKAFDIERAKIFEKQYVIEELEKSAKTYELQANETSFKIEDSLRQEHADESKAKKKKQKNELYNCLYCLKEPPQKTAGDTALGMMEYLVSQLELDHVVPLSAGGTNDIENIQLIPKKRNAVTSNKTEKKKKVTHRVRDRSKIKK